MFLVPVFLEYILLFTLAQPLVIWRSVASGQLWEHCTKSAIKAAWQGSASNIHFFLLILESSWDLSYMFINMLYTLLLPLISSVCVIPVTLTTGFTLPQWFCPFDGE